MANVINLLTILRLMTDGKLKFEIRFRDKFLFFFQILFGGMLMYWLNYWHNLDNKFIERFYV